MMLSAALTRHAPWLALASLLVAPAARAAPPATLRVLALGSGLSPHSTLAPYELRPVLPDPALRRLLRARGMQLDATLFHPGLTWELLKRNHVVVLLGLPAPQAGSRDAVRVTAQLKLLHRFVARGGGLLYLHLPSWGLGRGTRSLNRWLRRYRGRVLLEQVLEADAARRLRRPTLRTELAATGSLGRHSVTRGVAGLLYPTGHNAWHNYAQPLKLSRAWTVLARGSPTARSVRVVRDGDTSRFHLEPGSHGRAPPLAALRRAGRGRLALWPLASTCVWQDGFHPRWGGGLIMNGRSGALRGDALKLLTQLLSWLGQPSQRRRLVTVGEPRPGPPAAPGAAGSAAIQWDRVRLHGKRLPRHYMGLVGAQSGLSSGTGTPTEMITAARQAGYRFVAFTEDLARMTPAKTARLVRACQQGSSDTFQAVPGFYYLDQAGNHHVVFGPQVRWPRPRWRSSQRRGRVLDNNMLFRGLRFPPLAVVRSSTNPKPPWLLGNYKGFAVYTYRGGKLVDDSLAHYLRLQADGFTLFPLVLHLTRSPAAVGLARKAAMQTYARWHRGRDPVSAMSGLHGPVVGGQRLHHFPVFISEGPVIEDLRSHNAGTADLAIAGHDRFRTHLLVSGDRPLARVDLYDGVRPRYSFRPRRKRFGVSVDGYHDRQHQPLLVATDSAGRRAISWSRQTTVHEYHFVRGADNFNTFSGGKWSSSQRAPLRGVEDRLRHTTLHLLPRVMVFQGTSTPLLDTWSPAVRQQVVLAGRFGSVVQYSADAHYPLTTHTNWNAAKVQPVAPNKQLRFTVRVTRYRPRPDGALVDLVQTRVRALRDVRLSSHARGALTLGLAHGRQGLRLLQARPSAQGTIRQQTVAAAGGALASGGWAALSPAPGGSVAFVALSSGLSYRATRRGDQSFLELIGARPGARLRRGQTLSYRFLAINSGFAAGATRGSGFVQRLVRDLGLGVRQATAYRVMPRRGAVLGRRFVLRLAAARGAFCGSVSRAILPLDLPLSVRGLNPRWDALLWYRGKGRFVVPRWTTDQAYNALVTQQQRSATDVLRRFPVLQDGQGMAQLDLNLDPRELFIGHPVQAADRRLHIVLQDTRAGHEAIWLHNSEDVAISTTIWRDADFKLIPPLRRRVTVPAGGSLCVRPGKRLR